MFSRENRRLKRAKFKIYLSFEDCGASVVALSLGWWSCPLVAGDQASGVLSGCVPSFRPAFCPLCCFCFPASALKYALFRILRAFLAWFYMFGVGLCCLGALRGLWGFCTRVELGGFMACGVFASILYLLPCFLSCCLCFPLVVVLCSGCLYLFSCFVFAALWVCCCFFFPFGLCTKR